MAGMAGEREGFVVLSLFAVTLTGVVEVVDLRTQSEAGEKTPQQAAYFFSRFLRPREALPFPEPSPSSSP
jgi:hypothetical protein